MVKNFSIASLLFLVGYVAAVGLSVILFPINSGLRYIIIFGMVQIIFTEMHYVYLSRAHCDINRCFSEVIKVGSLWALMSIGLDILLFMIVIPAVMNGGIDLGFFNTQPAWYWMQFPMMIGTGLFARITYIKVFRIREVAAQNEELIIS